MSNQFKSVNPYVNAKSITPIAGNFGQPQATKLYVVSSSDNLSTAAVFSYTLISADNKSVATGTVVMSGTDYTNWSGDNNTPYTYVASKIGVTLV